MKDKSITVSEKYGVNPTLGVCFYCEEETGEIGLLGKLPGDAEAPKYCAFNMNPCPKCADFMKDGVILIEAEFLESSFASKEQPIRLGGWGVMRDFAIKRIMQEGKLRDGILRDRWAFVTPDVWKKIMPDHDIPDTRERKHDD